MNKSISQCLRGWPCLLLMCCLFALPSFGWTTEDGLWEAAKSGDSAGVRSHLAHGDNVNAKGGAFGSTALMETARMDQTETAALLIEHGADVNAESTFGSTALMHAAGMGQTETAALLIEHGADVNAEDHYGFTALMHAALMGRTEIAALLIEHGADVNAKDDKGKTALMYANQTRRTETVPFLEEAAERAESSRSLPPSPVRVSSPNQDLVDAARKGDRESIQSALAAGANVNATDNKGKTALMIAAIYGHTEIAALLIERGADVNAKDKNGRTALMIAERWRRTKIVRLLEKAGVVKR